MNTESVPMSITPFFVMMPPRQRTIASATEAAKAVVDMKTLRKCMARTLMRFISPVRPSNSRSTLSSITSVLVVFAPVMPSLNAPVMREFCSRTRRWKKTSFFWKYAPETTRTGTITITHSARCQLSTNIMTTANSRYAMYHTPSMSPQASVLAMRSVSDMTRAWM